MNLGVGAYRTEVNILQHMVLPPPPLLLMLLLMLKFVFSFVFSLVVKGYGRSSTGHVLCMSTVHWLLAIDNRRGNRVYQEADAS
jgi:hypothetical protein